MSAPCFMLTDQFNLVNPQIPKEHKTKRNYCYKYGHQHIFDRKSKLFFIYVYSINGSCFVFLRAVNRPWITREASRFHVPATLASSWLPFYLQSCSKMLIFKWAPLTGEIMLFVRLRNMVTHAMIFFIVAPPHSEQANIKRDTSLKRTLLQCPEVARFGESWLYFNDVALTGFLHANNLVWDVLLWRRWGSLT